MRSFDDYVREKLGRYEPEVPGYVWDRIEARKKKKRGLFWIFSSKGRTFLLLTLLILSSGIYFYRNDADGRKEFSFNTPSKNLHHPSIKNDYGPVPSADKMKGIVTAQNMAESATAQATAAPFTRNESGNSMDKNDRTASSLPKKSIISTTDLTRHSSFPTSQRTTTGKLPNGHATTKKSVSTKMLPETSSLTTVDERMESQEYGKGPRENSAERTMTAEASTDTDNNDFTTFVQKSESPENTRLRSLVFNPQKLMNRLPAFSIFPPGKKKFSVPPCPEELPASNYKYLEFFAGPDLVFTSYSDTSGSDYINKRKSASEVRFAYSIGTRFTKVFGNGMSIKTGINFSHILEKFSVLQGNVIQIIYIIGPSGDTLGNYATRTDRYIQSQNNYHTIDIPLLMGYEMNIGKWKANLNAGVMLNLYSWQNGLMIDTSGKVVSTKTGSGASAYQYKTNVGVGFLGSLSLYYPIREDVYLMAEPYFRYNLSAANREDISLRKRFHTSGIRLGLRYDFRKRD